MMERPIPPKTPDPLRPPWKRMLPRLFRLAVLAAAALLALGVTSGSLVFPLVFALGTAAFCLWILWMRRKQRNWLVWNPPVR